MPDTVIALIESADRCIDVADEQEMNDWEFIQSYIVSPQSLNWLSSLSSLPLMGRLFNQAFFEHQSLIYDITVNFVDAHAEATRMIQVVIENKEFTERILKEAQVNSQKADEHMHKHLEDLFPEICKEIQSRRAQYYLLVHEYHYIDKMLKNGQIEDKEAGALKNEIDSKIFYMTIHNPDIELAVPIKRLIYTSDLSDIFSTEDLKKAVEQQEVKDILFKEKQQIVGQKSMDMAGKVLFVARGKVIEKDGKYDDQIYELKHGRGNIACLQNLLPNAENEV